MIAIDRNEPVKLLLLTICLLSSRIVRPLCPLSARMLTAVENPFAENVRTVRSCVGGVLVTSLLIEVMLSGYVVFYMTYCTTGLE